MKTDKAVFDRRMVNDIVIKHDLFNRMLDRMEDLWRDAQARIPIVAPFIGETGTGKTTAIRSFVMQHPPRRTPDGLIIPVLAVNTPSKPTPRGLAERILRALGDPRPTSGSATAKLDRIIKNLEDSQVRIITLDDMQHFVDKRQQIAIFEVSDYLKELLISYDVALLCFGLPECELVIQSNEQLKTRSRAVFELQRFDWVDKASQDQFVAVLAAFQRGIEKFEFPNLASRDLSIRMYLATGGLIRYMSAILSKAIRNAIDAGVRKIRVEDLAAAWSEEVFGARTEYADPFARSFRLNDLPTKIAKAKALGYRATRPVRARDRKPGRALAEIGL